jgi:hypothetical protein
MLRLRDIHDDKDVDLHCRVLCAIPPGFQYPSRAIICPHSSEPNTNEWENLWTSTPTIYRL